MGSKKIRPVTPGMRGQVATDFKDITKKKPEKSLLQSKKSSGGRNNKGRITSRHRGGGHKQKYRVIDFKRVKDGIQARVAGIEYDPNRNARIALLHYIDGEKAYILLLQMELKLILLLNRALKQILKMEIVSH